MEKKTIGGFIAALRKANGMTQKDLAERLNVSDKTISRWERDDGAPDLSAIPVIAEIFGVTCDELLRGERRSPSERAENPATDETSAKGERQRRRLISISLSQYQNRTYIAMGIFAVGVIAALICNFVFFRAVLGFGLEAISLVCGVICQCVFINKAFFGIEDAQISEQEASNYNRRVIGLAKSSFGLAAACAGFTLPLVFLDAYMGLTWGGVLVYGTASALLFLIIYGIILFFLNDSFLKKGVYSLSEKQLAAYVHNRKLKRTCAVTLTVLLAATLIGHCFVSNVFSPWRIMDGTTFNDYSSFAQYMQQDIPYELVYDTYGDSYASVAQELIEDEQFVYYDYYYEDGSIITDRKEAQTCTLKDKNGNVVCEYVHRNESVILIEYAESGDSLLPITVHTADDLQKAEQKAVIYHVLFAAAYVIEIIAVVAVYFKKRLR